MGAHRWAPLRRNRHLWVKTINRIFLVLIKKHYYIWEKTTVEILEEVDAIWEKKPFSVGATAVFPFSPISRLARLLRTGWIAKLPAGIAANSFDLSQGFYSPIESSMFMLTHTYKAYYFWLKCLFASFIAELFSDHHPGQVQCCSKTV